MGLHFQAWSLIPIVPLKIQYHHVQFTGVEVETPGG